MPPDIKVHGGSRHTGGGWNYFEDSPSPRAHWNYGPGDYDDDRPSLSDLAGEDYRYDPEEFEELGYHEPHEDERYLRDPGFREACKVCHGKPDSEKCAQCRARERREGSLRDGALGFSEARRRVADDGGPVLFNPVFLPWEHLDERSMLLGEGGELMHWPTASQDPARSVKTAAAMERVGHGFAPGHRIGLPYKSLVIPGTVTHLDGGNVGVRWDDGQHSSENPWDILPL
jgi:hypothetical protein